MSLDSDRHRVFAYLRPNEVLSSVYNSCNQATEGWWILRQYRNHDNTIRTDRNDILITANACAYESSRISSGDRDQRQVRYAAAWCLLIVSCNSTPSMFRLIPTNCLRDLFIHRVKCANMCVPKWSLKRSKARTMLLEDIVFVHALNRICREYYSVMPRSCSTSATGTHIDSPGSTVLAARHFRKMFLTFSGGSPMIT